jgi:hypothetical protein
MPTTRFMSLTGEENVAPPFRTPTPTVTDELVAHVEAHARRAVRLCTEKQRLVLGDALPEDGVVVVAPTPHRTLAHVGALDPRDCVVVKQAVVDRHGYPLSFVIRNTRVTVLSVFTVKCKLTVLHWPQYRLLGRKLELLHGEASDRAVIPQPGCAHFYNCMPDSIKVGGDMDVVFHVHFGEYGTYGRIVSARKVKV